MSLGSKTSVIAAKVGLLLFQFGLDHLSFFWILILYMFVSSLCFLSYERLSCQLPELIHRLHFFITAPTNDCLSWLFGFASCLLEEFTVS